MQRHDVALTLSRRCINVMCPLGCKGRSICEAWYLHILQFIRNAEKDAGWSGLSLSANGINGYCSICRRTENVHIRLHRCACWSGPTLSENCIRLFFFFPRCTSFDKRKPWWDNIIDYGLSGTLRLTTLYKASFVSDAAHCVITDCGDPPHIPNSSVLPGENKEGESRHYICDGNYAPESNNGSITVVVTCLDTAEWTPSNFICVVGKLTVSPLSVWSELFRLWNWKRPLSQ